MFENYKLPTSTFVGINTKSTSLGSCLAKRHESRGCLGTTRDDIEIGSESWFAQAFETGKL